MTASACAECGAPLRDNEACITHFQELLALEAVVPNVPGEMPHFLAVASYGLQHPESMGYTQEALEGLRALLTDAVSGNVSVDKVRRRARYQMKKGAKVRRRPGEPTPAWPVAEWRVTVTDVLAGGASGYIERVEGWAQSVVERLRGLALSEDGQPGVRPL